jgi:hypothetical protein
MARTKSAATAAIATPAEAPADAGTALTLHVTDESEISHLEALRVASAAVGLGAAAALNRLAAVSALARVKETRAWRALGVASWDAYCADVLQRAKSAVDEDILNLDRLGEEVYGHALLAGLGRRDLRVLRGAQTDELPRLNDDGRLEIGGTVYDPEDSTQIGAALQELVTELSVARMRAEDAAAAAQVAKEEMEDARAETEEVRARLQARAQEEKATRARRASHADLLQGLTGLLLDLGAAVERVEAEMPDDRVRVEEIARMMGGLVGRLTTYALQRYDAGLEESLRRAEAEEAAAARHLSVLEGGA